MRALLALLLWLMPVAAALAQEDDRGRLTRFLEESLSDAGREVRVTGFRGALSSRATAEEITIADAQGVWLVMRGLVLDWNRLEVLRGNISVNELSAREIVVARPPLAGDGAAPEAPGFALPDLPVAVDIGRLAAARVELGAGVLGQAFAGSMEASLRLKGGEGEGRLTILRADAGPAGRFVVAGGYSNATRRLTLSLEAEEEAGGIAASLAGIPAAPALALTVSGEGPVDDFAARVALTAGGAERVAGEVAVRRTPGGDSTFRVDLGGDLAGLVVPAHAAFFGPDTRLVAEGTRSAAGALDLARLALTARALRLEGSLALAADLMPERIALTGRLADPAGGPVLLPLSGPPVTVAAADLALGFDAAAGEGWTARASVTGLAGPGVSIADLALEGAGSITRPGAAGAARGVAGTLRLTAGGVAPADPALAAALGPQLTGEAALRWTEGAGALAVERLTLAAAGGALDGAGRIAGLASGWQVTGRARLTAPDLARFAPLAAMPLAGAAEAGIEGSASPLGGGFDLTLDARTRDLALGQREADLLLAGDARLTASALRDGGGIALRSLALEAGGGRLTASGQVASAGSRIAARLDLPDLGRLGPGRGGSLEADLTLSGAPQDGQIALAATGRDLRTGQAAADRLLAGESRLTLDLGLAGGKPRLDGATFGNPQMTARATAEGSAAPAPGGPRRLAVEARLSDLALVVPGFPGPLTLAGTLEEGPGGPVLDLRAEGPGQTAATVQGSLSPDLATADLAIRGSAQAGLANPFLAPRAVSGALDFDLRLQGPATLASLSGPVRLSGGRLSDPALPFALADIAASATLAGGAAQVEGAGSLTTRGRVAVAGRVGLAAPYAGDLAVTLAGARLRDPDLYSTTADGTLQISGPLAGGPAISGRIALGETELRIPAAGFGGAGAVPGLAHVHEPAAVRATRARAGLDGTARARRAGGGASPLDLTISAPSQVFLRGRGLDAELGGEVVLRGTTAAVAPAGGLELIRGRLDLLGRRLELTQGRIVMQGDLVPFVEVSAESAGEGITAFVTVSGPLDSPEVRFTSSPELPEEEVLAQLLFGQGIASISPLQAARLAGAVATLAGRGGEGIIGRLREGFGLADLDLQTAADGGATLRAGRYLTEKVYSDVEVDPTGRSRINLNLDIRRGLTVKGRVGSDGDAGLGLFLERDY